MTETHVQLFGGEQDGYRTNIELRGAAPEMFYIWPAALNEKIAMATGKKRMLLADKLAVLAYRLDESSCRTESPGSRAELRYLRHADADKKLTTDPAV